ncbi:MAG: hypothetical protein LBI99_09115 [Propionibacteriaceae bacterium]|jgi:hypothetical protein|nr:hypothetical protein [Propionibacteriaceae bacterium]
MSAFDCELASAEQSLEKGLFAESADFVEKSAPLSDDDLRKQSFLSARLVEMLIDAGESVTALGLAESTLQRFQPIFSEALLDDFVDEAVRSFLLAAAATRASVEYEQVLEGCLGATVEITKSNWLGVFRFISLVNTDRMFGPEVGRNAFHINQWVAAAKREWADVPLAIEIMELGQLVRSPKRADSMEQAKAKLRQISALATRRSDE